METKLISAFKEFVDDLKNVTNQQFKFSYTHDEIKTEFEKTENIDISSLFIFDIPVGKIYQCAGSNSKIAIENHLKLLRRLSLPTDNNDDGSHQDINNNLLPIANALNSNSLEKIATLVSEHKKDSDSVVDVLRKVVNSREFEKVALDLTKNFSGLS